MKPLRMRSMQARLTLLLGAIALLVSSLAGATLFWALKREVERQEITEVSGKLELIDHLIDMQNNARGLKDLAATFDEMRAGEGQLGIWIVDAHGHSVYGGPAPETLATGDGRQVVLQTADGGRMRGLRVAMNDRILPGAQLTVAVSTRTSSQFLYAYGTALVLICALWVGATVVLAAWAVRRSMAPARRLSEQAASIQPDNLARRLPLEDTDRELHELVRSFNRTLERLQAAYQQMEGFNADVAHELRTPLATLINGTQVMLSSPRDAAELRDALESNLEELEDLKTLVNDMLFLARADRGERAADLAPVSLAAEARRVAEYYEATLEESGVHLRCAGDATVAANAGLVRRALANLISNAIKATPRGGEIVLTCSASPAGARVEVRNPGPPIPPTDLPRIFDRFFRSSQARAPRSEGHGLGLAIVRAIARMHGGEVDAASGAHGTVVGITLRAPEGHATADNITKS
ncbi:MULTISPECIES: heavy metal sensor histidine kinase [Achromobacter]|jgi:two-component system heavy metal sensor histidine kinase CusS|uniref:Sensor protein n=1 Tax=Achromobacter aegrifaciens TaxID=1287736 RepID=A0ABU2DJB4_ACHAE|nr:MULTISPECIES: heavy metal sensor histidine kinase [Achromobacter]MBD9383211.1 heavy metal sensor histidine kinase [Achromobacter sp. ACM02]MBD9430262.1 heavy metal sensor histidine kinase [Achromobacter sp. ACM03]MBD9471797.1 heavy metal sensor histidine kinase [Achromobacter sp. ACM01]MDQ1760953.1 heavy metal sensor histidine kinase [Achromobacter aegrifaciens]MDR7948186.1 heavy metal sensor histidine kinase [Achromobacter aegrifaciens]